MASNEQLSTAAIQRTVYFTGSVQGVGFRYTAQTLAFKFDVTGVVRNLVDGRVELIAEGTPVELDRMLEAIDQAMAGNITATEVSDCEPTGQYEDFQITF